MALLFQVQMIKCDPLQILTSLQVGLNIKLEAKQKIFCRFLHEKQILIERKRQIDLKEHRKLNN